MSARAGRCAAAAIAGMLTATSLVTVSAQQRPLAPQIGQPGKDVQWFPTAQPMVEPMLDLAQVTADDFVVDLGSGDGRNVIAAAKRGARALGVEYDQALVEVSQRSAQAAGVTNNAQFVQGDMYLADVSEADVLVLFLQAHNLRKLRPQFEAMRPGSRIVSNTFVIEGWSEEQSVEIGDCVGFCKLLLYIVPARVDGSWQLGDGTLTLLQTAQTVSGTLESSAGSLTVSGRVTGSDLTLDIGGERRTARVVGDTFKGTSAAGLPWQAQRVTQ